MTDDYILLIWLKCIGRYAYFIAVYVPFTQKRAATQAAAAFAYGILSTFSESPNPYTVSESTLFVRLHVLEAITGNQRRGDLEIDTYILLCCELNLPVIFFVNHVWCPIYNCDAASI